MTKVTTRDYLNGECISETVQTYIGDELVQEVVSEFDRTVHQPKKKSYREPTALADSSMRGRVRRKGMSPESIERMLATRAVKRAKREEEELAWTQHQKD